MRHVSAFLLVTLIAGAVGLAVELLFAGLLIAFWPMLTREWEALASGVLLLCILVVVAWITRKNR